MEKRWRIRSTPDSSQVQILQNELNITQPVAEMLVSRGIDDFLKAKDFFRPELSQLHDPFLMKDMDRAVERLKTACEKGEKIWIYGDYDVDGTTAVALCFSFFKNHFKNIDYYIPDRYEEGYGISYKSIDLAHENDVQLIVALDCGIKAVEKIKYAKEKGIDYIICDHHRPGDELPDGIVLDPKRDDCQYPYKELSGCGIGFKLVQAFQKDLGKDEQEVFQYLDFCAISIAADIVPITEENRVMSFYGLQLINKNPRPGIKALLKSRKNKITVTDLVFGAAPQWSGGNRSPSNGRLQFPPLLCANQDERQRLIVPPTFPHLT